MSDSNSNALQPGRRQWLAQMAAAGAGMAVGMPAAVAQQGASHSAEQRRFLPMNYVR